eukprot:CAMPEP_0206616398 /NCGR_PEP_ID=MMETSP0325_2-20121206/58973_1 /ASSEMBLY_ACC=CAM_ASM_000347 /TAXON_ID=2866 /ORGANISM="Crypthecodinium cohnii, Strain Seligo" /LENGTH=55 /DNA_ID=CAMNT_0054138097 /DNA_START=1 /DNA_END=165 /DNA_ORIENTATION=-
MSIVSQLTEKHLESLQMGIGHIIKFKEAVAKWQAQHGEANVVVVTTAATAAAPSS